MYIQILGKEGADSRELLTVLGLVGPKPEVWSTVNNQVIQGLRRGCMIQVQHPR